MTPRTIANLAGLSNRQKGIFAMIGMCLCLTIMFVSGLKAIELDAKTSPVALSYIRVIINFFIVVIYCKLFLPNVKLFGNGSWTLWARGLFGAGNYVLMFYAVNLAGLSTASFLNSGSSVLVALLAVPLLREKFDKLSFFASLASLFGLYLVFGVNFEVNPIGTLMAGASAVCLAIAHLAMAKSTKSNSSHTIIFYFCLCSLIVHIALQFTVGITFPTDLNAWMFILIGSISGILSQYLLTYAYAKGSAQVNAALYFLAPAFNLAASIIIFSMRPTFQTVIGGMVIIVFGVIVSYRRFSQKQQTSNAPKDRSQVIVVRPASFRTSPKSLLPRQVTGHR